MNATIATCVILLKAIVNWNGEAEIFIPHTSVEAIKVKGGYSYVTTNQHTYKILNGQQFKDAYEDAIQECNTNE